MALTGSESYYEVSRIELGPTGVMTAGPMADTVEASGACTQVGVAGCR